MHIRLMTDGDVDAVVRLWYTSGRQAYTFIELWQAFTLEKAGEVFRAHILPVCDIWVAEREAQIVGYLAMHGSYLDRLYVTPDRQRAGVGTALLEYAMQRSPTGLELHTHQKNAPARAFYEKYGFVAVKFGISPAPENEPDVEYHWRPQDTAP